MDPRKQLEIGQTAAEEGRYAEALRAYVWFHDHALKHEPSLYGVRLSFALGYWMDLGKLYPRAIKKLESIRDKKTSAILRGRQDRDLFHDVESINQCLRADQLTCDLFREIDRQYPEFARKCAPLALEALAQCGDFELAHRYSPEPEDALLSWSDGLNRDIDRIDREPPTRAPRLKAYVHIYCCRVRNMVDVLQGVGQRKQADYVLEWAVALVDGSAMRRKVAKALEQKWPRSPV